MAERYWLFALVCASIAALVLRLITRERITLQSSLAFLAFLAMLAAMAIFPDGTLFIARAMGFTLASNFLFSIAIGALALLHVFTLMNLSKLELRSITLIQELGILREQLDRKTSFAEQQCSLPAQSHQQALDERQHDARR